MRNTRKILVSVLVVLLAIAVCTVAYASNVSYHSNGKPSMIKTSKEKLFLLMLPLSS